MIFSSLGHRTRKVTSYHLAANYQLSINELKMQNESGWIKLHRSLLKWEWYDDINCSRLFIHLLLAANREPKSWRGLTIERGQKLTSRAKLSRETKLSERQIRTCLERLQSTNELTIKATKKETVITICKYDTYQSTADFTDQGNDQQSVRETTSKRPSNEQEANKAKTQEAVSETSVSSCQLALQDRPQPHRINGAKKAKPVPYQKIIDLFCEKCPSFVRPRQLDDKRRKGARKLWGRAKGHQNPDKAWEYIGVMFDAAQESAFLRGEKPSKDFPNWKASFEYITRDDQITKIMEGGYNE